MQFAKPRNCSGFALTIALTTGPSVPEIRRLDQLWHSTPLKNLSLTTVGIAIGHANLARLSGFKSDLSIWIQ